MSLTPKSGKKYRDVQKDVLRELIDERGTARLEPRYAKPNRDQARGDWNRTGGHGDRNPSGSYED
jgi:hypothetical protein